MKVLQRLVAFVLLPVVGYLVGATIFFAFWDRIEVGDPDGSGYAAVAQSCERRGPVSYKGFGYWYTCAAKVTQRAPSPAPGHRHSGQRPQSDERPTGRPAWRSSCPLTLPSPLPSDTPEAPTE